MIRLSLLMLYCSTYCAVTGSGQRSLPICCTTSQVSCTFDTTLCGWVSNSSRPDFFYWTVKGGEAHFDTSNKLSGGPQRRATLRSPVICDPQDCRTLRLEFDYRFSYKGGGLLYVHYLGQNNLLVQKILEMDGNTQRSENNIPLVNRGIFQIVITGDNDEKERIGSDIFLDNLSLRYLDCETTSATPDREVTTKPADTVNCSAFTGLTSTKSNRTPLATEGDDSKADSVDSDFTAKKDEGSGNERGQTTIIISACVGSGIVLAGVVVTVIVCSRRRRGQNREMTVEGGRAAGARHSSLMMENELYLCMTHNGDPATDSTHANGGTMEMKEMQPPGPSATMTLVKSQAASNYYSTLSEDDEVTHHHTTTAEKGPDARETTLPNSKRLQIVSLDIAREQSPAKRDALSPGHNGLCEIFDEQSGEGEPAAADHEYARVKEDDDDDEPDDDGDDDDERLRPEDHYDLIHDSSSGRHVYSNEAGSFDGASVMTLRSQDNVFASAAVGGDDEPQQENVYDAIASS